MLAHVVRDVRSKGKKGGVVVRKMWYQFKDGVVQSRAPRHLFDRTISE